MEIPTRTSPSYQWLHDRERYYLSCLIIGSTLFEFDPYYWCFCVGLPADLACWRSQLLPAAVGRRTVSRLYSAHGWWIGAHVCRCLETISNETRPCDEYAWKLDIVGTCQTSQYCCWHSDPLGRIYYSGCHPANRGRGSSLFRGL